LRVFAGDDEQRFVVVLPALRPDSGNERAYRLIFGKRFVGIAVQPAFAGLRGSDDRVPAGVRVFTGVPIRRTVAAQRHATLLAGSEMDPRVADFHALRAFAKLRLLY
jgi:hypothetical protein